MLLNAAKWQGYSFYRFRVIKGKPSRGREEVKLPPPTQIRYKNIYFQEHLRELFFLFWLQYGTLFDYKLGTLQFIFQKFYIYWNESMTALFV